jgi:hypothetical protein
MDLDDPNSSKRGRPKKAVRAIKDSRTKKGELQYRVAYDLDPDSRTYWASSNQLSCPDLIEQFEANDTKAKPKPKAPRQPPLPAEKVTEVLGLSHHNNELYYVVRFGNSPEPHFISRVSASRRCARQVLDFYQKHLTFESEVGTDEFEQLLEVRGMQPIVQPTPAVEAEPVSVDRDSVTDL